MRKQSIFSCVFACALLACGNGLFAADPTPEEILASKGLAKNGAMYLLAPDINVASIMAPVREVKTKIDDTNRSRATLVRSIRSADLKIEPLFARYKELKVKIDKTRDPANHNQYVDAINGLVDRMRQIEKAQNDDKAKLSKVPDYSDDYTTALGKASLKLEAAAQAYETLSADAAVKGALDAITKKGGPPALLGPSVSFKRELTAVRKEARVLKPDVIKFEANRSVAIINVTVNGTVTTPMIVDSGATFVSLSTEVAAKLEIKPGPNDRTVKTKIANGDIVDATLVKVKSIRVGQYTVENIDCLIQPKMAAGADCLLGVSFLENFIYRMDLTAGELHLKPGPGAKVKVGDGEAAADVTAPIKTAAANAPTGTPGKKIDLLALIDPKKDTVGGTWTVKDKKLISDAAAAARIKIPYLPPEEYDFTIEFSRTSGPDGILQLGTTGTSPLQWVLGGNANRCFGFLTIDDHNLEPKNPTFVQQRICLTNGQKYLSVMKVRRDSVQVYVDGKLIAGFHPSVVKIGSSPTWAFPKPSDFGVGSCASPAVFTRIELTEISGSGKPLRPNP